MYMYTITIEHTPKYHLLIYNDPFVIIIMIMYFISFSCELTPPNHLYTLIFNDLSTKISSQYHVFVHNIVELTHK